VIFGLEENRNETYSDNGNGDKVFDRNNVLKNLVIFTYQVIRLAKRRPVTYSGKIHIVCQKVISTEKHNKLGASDVRIDEEFCWK